MLLDHWNKFPALRSRWATGAALLKLDVLTEKATLPDFHEVTPNLSHITSLIFVKEFKKKEKEKKNSLNIWHRK